MDAVAREKHLRRQALQLASQLPDDRADAAQILRYCDELLCGFLAEPVAANGGSDNVLLSQPREKLTIVKS